MREFTIVIDCYIFNYDELKSYLLSLTGVVGVKNIDIDDLLRLKIKYDYTLITYHIIYLEILAFLDMLDNPLIFEFDKHSNDELKTYEKEINSICCEYCYSSCINDLFNIDGVNKITSNFYLKKYKDRYKNEKYKVIVSYNPKLISEKKLAKMVDELEE